MVNLRTEFDFPVPTVVLAEGEFGKTGGKTANGVVMHSEIFEARAVVDSECAGEQPEAILHYSDSPDIPIVRSVAEALEISPEVEVLVIGAATAGGTLPESWVDDIETAMEAGCDIVSGLHIFLSEQKRWRELANENQVRIFDVRKPPERTDLRVGDGSVDDVEASIVLTLGTDCAVGKRTTTFELYKAATQAGLNAGWVATGQTGIMVGAQSGVVIDRVPADFTAGVVEDLVSEVAEEKDLVFVEGQASLTHRTYSGVTLSILHGSWPDAVVLADDPTRTERTHYEMFDVEGVARERRLIESLSGAKVVALSTWGDHEEEAANHELPAADVYQEEGPEKLLSAVQNELESKSDSNGFSTPEVANE